MKPKRRNAPENLRRYEHQISKLNENAAANTASTSLTVGEQPPSDDARFSVKKKQNFRKRDRKMKRDLKKAKKHAFYTKQTLEELIERGEVKGIRRPPPKKAAKERTEKQNKKQIKKKEQEREARQKEIEEKQRLARVEGLKEENKREDRAIRKYEKLLGIKKKRKNYQMGFYNDGFDQLLDFCDEEKREKIVEEEAKVYGENVWMNDVAEESSEGSQEEEEEGEEGSQEEKVADEEECDSDDESGSAEEGEEEDGEMASEEEEGSRRRTKVAEEECDSDDESGSAEEEEEDDGMASEEEMEASGGDESGDDASEMAGDDEDEQEEPEKPDTWEDIYGRLRDKRGNIIRDNNTGAAATGEAAADGVAAMRPRGDRLEAAGANPQMDKLQKRLKGLLNRLSESNVIAIAREIEGLFRENSRHLMTTCLIRLMLTSLVRVEPIPERILTDHALLVAILNSSIGSEVGAVFMEEFVEKYNELIASIDELDARSDEGKEMNNLLQFFCYFYHFKITESDLIYDLLMELGELLNEKRVEAILVMLKVVGFALRKDNPLRLKELILLLQQKASAGGEAAMEAKEQSRVRFLLDVMMSMKNNNMSKMASVDRDYLDRLVKLFRSCCKGSGTNTLNIRLKDFRDAKTKGKWWIVGSSWRPAEAAEEAETEKQPAALDAVSDAKLGELARKQRMNTDVRRAIFAQMMTSEDYVDAFEKLLKLGLNRQQERELVHVAIHCCLQEKPFNPFYVHLAQRFCHYDRRFKMSFQFAFWDKIKELARLSKDNVRNLASMLARLIEDASLPLSVLKTVSFGDMDRVKMRFLRAIFVHLCSKLSSENLEAIVGRVTAAPKLKLFRESVRLFVQHFVLAKKSDDEDSSLLSEEQKERAQLVVRLLSSGASTVKL